MVGLQLRQELKLTQQLVMTPQLQMAIKLLQLSQLELVDTVQQELTENPLLEEGPEVQPRSSESASSPGEQAGEKQKLVSSDEAESQNESQKEKEVREEAQVDWERYLESHANQAPMPSSFRPDTDDMPSLEATLTRSASLFDHLLWQIRMASFVDNEKRFALLVIGNLDSDGYLARDVTVEELAVEAGLHPEDAEEVLQMVQELDPAGVGARNLRECLSAQVRVFELDEDVEAIVDRHLADLKRRDYKAIARELKISVDDVYDAADIISTLEPRPGRNLTGEEAKYITPDVYVHNIDGEYFVVPNDDGMPKLRISGYYRSALTGDKQPKDYIKGKLRSAQWLIRSIDQRRRTIIKVTECIVERQREFFDKGIEYLRPMILRDVAESVGMHESTISRVTNNKYVHTPRGIFELKYFFNPGIRCRSGRDVASESVKQHIKRHIDGEDKAHPLSDQKIVAVLAATGVIIARRTVAKYREALGILSSTRRRQTQKRGRPAQRVR